MATKRRILIYLAAVQVLFLLFFHQRSTIRTYSTCVTSNSLLKYSSLYSICNNEGQNEETSAIKWSVHIDDNGFESIHDPWKTRIDLSDIGIPQLNVSKLSNWNNCTDEFRSRFIPWCEKLTEKLSESNSLDSKGREFCPCLPSDLVGVFKPLNSSENLKSLENEVGLGGEWSPSDCRARQRVAIIIPYRDRKSHLNLLLSNLHPFIQRQKISYQIFVIEQDDITRIFNKGVVMNVGFLEAYRGAVRVGAHSTYPTNTSDYRNINDTQRINTLYTAITKELLNATHDVRWGPFDCFIFHDVDMLPEDDRNIYTCTTTPRHVGAYLDKYRYNLKYWKMFGGSTAFTAKQFKIANGFATDFYGWGGEDDDMYQRMSTRFKDFVRFPRCVAKYQMIKHGRDRGNPSNPKGALGWSRRVNEYKKNGLNNMRYTVLRYQRRSLYTWILISVPPAPRELHHSVINNDQNFTSEITS